MRWKTILTGIGVLIIGLLIAALQLAPRVESITAADQLIHGPQPIQFTFSRRMDPESVLAHLTLDPPYPGSLEWSEDGRQAAFIPDQSWTPGSEVSFTLSRGALSHLKLPLLRTFSESFSVSPYLLTYLWPADQTSNIYSLNPQTGDGAALTEQPEGVLDYAALPDGSALIYSTPSASAGSQIISLNRWSGEENILVECAAALCRSPVPSPDGTRLAYEIIPRQPDARPGIRLYHFRDQSTETVGSSSHYLDNPRWSSTGWLSYYNHTEQQFVLWHPEKEQEITLANQTGGPVSWDAEGRYFLFTEIYNLSDLLAPRHLLRFDLVRKNIVDLTQAGYYEDLNPAYAPEGEALAFTRKSLIPSEWIPGRQLTLLEDGEEALLQLTADIDFNHTSISWHPSGQRLAYVRHNQTQPSDPPEIWMINRDGTGKIRLVINGFAPGWIP